MFYEMILHDKIINSIDFYRHSLLNVYHDTDSSKLIFPTIVNSEDI